MAWELTARDYISRAASHAHRRKTCCERTVLMSTSARVWETHGISTYIQPAAMLRAAPTLMHACAVRIGKQNHGAVRRLHAARLALVALCGANNLCSPSGCQHRGEGGVHTAPVQTGPRNRSSADPCLPGRKRQFVGTCLGLPQASPIRAEQATSARRIKAAQLRKTSRHST
jgi:hypothetical protein